jgi:hypothetical protein
MAVTVHFRRHGTIRLPAKWRGGRMRPSRGQVIGTLGAVALLAALVVVGRLDAPGRLGRLSAPAPAGTTETIIGLPTPPRPRGVPLEGTGLAALLIPDPSPSAIPGLFWLDRGRLTPIGGLPHGGCYLSPTRLPHGWALGRQVYKPTGQRCRELSMPTRFYLLADGASRARRLPVTADRLVADGDDSRLWLITFLGQPDPTSNQPPPQAIQQVDRTGHPHSPRYLVPAGYAARQGLGGGLLLLVRTGQGSADTSRFALWNPRSGRMLRRYDRVLGASETTIAWVAVACGPTPCLVHLSDLAAGTDIQLAVPWRARASTGAFSPDGRHLAVVFGGGGAAGAVTQARVGVIDLAARRLLAVPGAVVGGDDVGLAVSWSPDGAWLLVSARVGPLTEQLAAWRPGDTVLHVPRRQPPTGQHLAPAW